MYYDTTPLYALSQALCNKKESRLFNNQVIMYQLLIHFFTVPFAGYANPYSPSNIDNLIPDIRRYLLFMYSHPVNKTPSAETHYFSSMHKFIYDNLVSHNYSKEMAPFYGKKYLLSVSCLSDQGISAPNVNHSIKNERALPKEWTRLLQKKSLNYTQLLYRFFWLLQYFFVYYNKELCTINDNDLQNRSSSNFVEYFSLNKDLSTNLYYSLNKYCGSYTDYFVGNTPDSIDFLSLSRIILDVIIKHVRLRNYVNPFNLDDIPSILNKNKDAITETAQLADFNKYVDGFGGDSYDRYNMLLKFAPTNCYAAQELAENYYWGKTYWIGDNNYFELEQNYEKAAEWYIKAIENSNPPLQGSCWSLAYTLFNMHHKSTKEKEEAEAKALEYLKLAGEYPAAYNLIAWFTFRDAEDSFEKYKYSPDYYEEILTQFRSAIHLADRAGKMHWFYGNNQIAIFLTKHKSDEKLISDLSCKLSLQTPFDVESQLKKAASYNNPWALKHLAMHYFEQGKRDEAFSLFQKAMDSNYNSAFYETAIRFYETGSKEWNDLLEKASNLSYPEATFALAENESNPTKKLSLKELCKQQILAEKHLNTSLLDKLNTI